MLGDLCKQLDVDSEEGPLVTSSIEYYIILDLTHIGFVQSSGTATISG
jgi:hypothetical protein